MARRRAARRAIKRKGVHAMPCMPAKTRNQQQHGASCMHTWRRCHRLPARCDTHTRATATRAHIQARMPHNHHSAARHAAPTTAFRLCTVQIIRVATTHTQQGRQHQIGGAGAPRAHTSPDTCARRSAAAAADTQRLAAHSSRNGSGSGSPYLVRCWPAPVRALRERLNSTRLPACCLHTHIQRNRHCRAGPRRSRAGSRRCTPVPRALGATRKKSIVPPLGAVRPRARELSILCSAAPRQRQGGTSLRAPACRQRSRTALVRSPCCSTPVCAASEPSAPDGSSPRRAARQPANQPATKRAAKRDTTSKRGWQS